jgi:hypothetical protein
VLGVDHSWQASANVTLASRFAPEVGCHAQTVLYHVVNSLSTTKNLMYPFPQPFVDACNAAMWDIGVNLARLTLERGPRDFPQDGGIAYRNHLYKYVYCYFIWVLYPALHPDTKDEWSQRNRELVLSLRTKQVKQAVGLSHAHVRCRQLFQSFDKSRSQAAQNPQLLATTEKLAAKSFDWLVVMYDFSAELANQFLKLITTSPDMAAYTEASRNFFCSHLGYALGLDPDDTANADLWASLAVSAEQTGAALKPEEWQPIVTQLMKLYVDEASRQTAGML